MKIRIYSIYDKAAQYYNRPFYAHNDAVALRSFRALRLDYESEIHRHPEDFSLFYLGTFDDSSGLFVWDDTKCIARAHELSEPMDVLEDVKAGGTDND